MKSPNSLHDGRRRGVEPYAPSARKQTEIFAVMRWRWSGGQLLDKMTKGCSPPIGGWINFSSIEERLFARVSSSAGWVFPESGKTCERRAAQELNLPESGNLRPRGRAVPADNWSDEYQTANGLIKLKLTYGSTSISCSPAPARPIKRGDPCCNAILILRGERPYGTEVNF